MAVLTSPHRTRPRFGLQAGLVAARVDFAAGLEDEQVERASEEIDRRMREAVPDVTEVFLDATTAPRDQRG